MTPELHQRIGKLYSAALELEPSQRAAFLGAACAGDNILREQVESLLALDDDAKDFMEFPALELAAGLIAQEPEHSIRTGTRLGPYEIVSSLGKGGMGEVYRARDTKLRREVAVKILPKEFAQDQERVGRFQRESELLAALNHPNLAAIYGVEETG